MFPDPIILLCLVVVLAASFTIFWLHLHRDTSQRAEVLLAEYADRLHMRRMDADAKIPPPLNDVPGYTLKLLFGFCDHTTHVMRLRSEPGHNAPAQEWNLLLRAVPMSSSPVGLRPTDAVRSITDAFGLQTSAWQDANRRFTVVGHDLLASTRIAESSGRALLPPDLSLMRHGQTLIIDFSARPFDEVSIDRVRALADQLASVV